MNTHSDMPLNTLTEWSRLLVGALYASGVRELVVSPGSRSTPFLAAALSHGALKCYSLFDERSSAFFALGIARGTGRPVALLCTSGTAPAHYFPAVIEASESGLPLIVLSADRPLELQNCHAPQTIDQTRLFGTFVRSYVDLGLPDSSEVALRGLKRRVIQAVALSTGILPGPVHLNARARKPLEPLPPASEDEHALCITVDRILYSPMNIQVQTTAVGHSGAFTEAIVSMAERLLTLKKGLILVGPVSCEASILAPLVRELSYRLGYPFLPEATSQLRFCGQPCLEPQGTQPVIIDGFEHLLRDAGVRLALAPEVVIQVGSTPTSGALDAWLSLDPSVERYVLCPDGVSDPHQTASMVLSGDIPQTLHALLAVLKGTLGVDAVGPEAASEALKDATSASDPDRERAADLHRWDARWAYLNSLVWRGINECLSCPETQAIEAGGEGSVEPHFVSALIEAIPDGFSLLLGNSLPIREVDLYARARSGISRVYCQRGANGIDGLVSTAGGLVCGAARPLIALSGDVTFLHDTNGLSALRNLPAPLVIVVLNNGGGRIFELLPVGKSSRISPEALSYWTTPPLVHIRKLCEAYELPHLLTTSAGSVRSLLEEAVVLSQAQNRGVVLELVTMGETTAQFAFQCRTAVTATLHAGLAELFAEAP